MNTRSFFRKAAVLFVVVTVACGSVFASDAVSGSIVKLGMAQNGFVGLLASEAGVDGVMALNVSDDFAEGFVEAYFGGSTSEFGAEKAELLPEEVDALGRSAQVVMTAGEKLGPLFLENTGISLEDSATLKAFADACVKSIENIRAGDITRADVFSVAGMIGVITDLDEIKFEADNGKELSIMDYFLLSEEDIPTINEEKAQTDISLGIMGAVIYFDVLCNAYGIDLAAADFVPELEF